VKTRKLVIIVGGLLTLIFILGIGRLFILRFKTGDIYPVYSTLRSDPLGTRVFYESILYTGRIAVTRHFSALKNIQPDPPVTVFYLGVSASFFDLHSPELIPSLYGLAAGGARLVLTLNSQKETACNSCSEEDISKQEDADTRSEKDPSESAPQKDSARRASDDSGGVALETLNSRWGVTVTYDRSLEKSGRVYLNPVYAGSGLPNVISRHSAYYFDDLSSDWRVIYRTDERPVVIEKSLGRGEIVLLADTFWASNEALRDERHPGLLAWLAGPHPRAVFDESHLGLREQPGVVALARRNRLHWPLMGIILLALLFVWKNAVPLVPAQREAPSQRTGVVPSAKDYTQGLISLLHRSIAKSRILETTLDQWRKDLPRNKTLSENRLKRIQAVLDGAGTSGRKTMADPVSAYGKIYSILTERSDDEP